MAKNRDIAGLLTDIPSSGLNPMDNLTSDQLMTRAFMGGMEQMGRGLRGLFGQDRRTPQEILAGDIKNFKNLTPERQRGLIGTLQASGQTGLAGTLTADLQKQTLATKATADALLVADSLPSEYSQLAEAIRKGVTGALGKGIEILGRKKTEVEQPKGEKPTATDIKSAKKALSLAGEEAKGGEAFGFLGTDWNDAWNNQTEAAKDLLATQVAEVTNKLIKPPASLDLSEARKIAIQKMYTDNLTKTGLFEWGKGESRMMTADEIAERKEKELEARLAKPDYQ